MVRRGVVVTAKRYSDEEYFAALPETDDASFRGLVTRRDVRRVAKMAPFKRYGPDGIWRGDYWPTPGHFYFAQEVDRHD